SPSAVSFQVTLQLNTGNTPGTVTYYYPDLTTEDGNDNGISATVGIRGTGSGNVLQVSYNAASPYVGDGRAILFSVPVVSSITRPHPDPTNDHDVRYQVVFSRAVTGVDIGDFAVTTTGVLTGPGVTDVTGSGSTYVVTVDTGDATGDNGTLRLDL